MPSRIRIFAAFAVVFFLAAASRADNWERFRGPNGTGIANDKNIPVKFSATENVRWKVKLDGTGNGSPIVWGDRVFLQAASADATQRSLYCFDAKTGKEIWKRSIPGAKVKLSRPDTSNASATPTTDGQAVYIPFWNGKDVILAAYNFKGDKLWDRNLGEWVSQHGPGASPIVFKDLLIFSIDKDAFHDTVKKTGPVANPSTLYALDKKTGKTVWEIVREPNRACYSMPFLLQKPGTPPELIFTSMTALTSYEPTTGKTNWEWKWTGVKDPLRTVNSTQYANGMFLNCTGDGNGSRQMVGVALNGQGKDVQPKKAWLIDADKSVYKKTPYVTCMLTRGEYVYFVGDYGHVARIEPKTGEMIWLEQLRDAKAFYASPIMVDGKIYAASDPGDVYVFEVAPQYQLLAQNSLGEQIRATPAVANGALYIRTKDHLYCIGGK